MRDITSRPLLYAKAILFVVLSALCALLILSRDFHWRDGVLLAICIWAACRAYFFVFYVIEHYVDPSFRYRGVWSVLVAALRRRSSAADAAR
jgi:hypothetical protein